MVLLKRWPEVDGYWAEINLLSTNQLYVAELLESHRYLLCHSKNHKICSNYGANLVPN